MHGGTSWYAEPKKKKQVTFTFPESSVARGGYVNFRKMDVANNTEIQAALAFLSLSLSEHRERPGHQNCRLTYSFLLTTARYPCQGT